MKKYLKEIDDKIEQLTNIAKVRLEQEDLTAMEEHNLDDTLDRLHKYHGRKNMIETYVTENNR